MSATDVGRKSVPETATCATCEHAARWHRRGPCGVTGCACEAFVASTLDMSISRPAKPIEKWEAEERANRLAATITVRCADCLWEETGPQSDARMAWARHRRDVHGDDRAVEMVQRSLNGHGKRRTSGGKVAISQDPKKLDENIRATRLAGGGHGEKPDAKPVRPATLPSESGRGSVACKVDGCQNEAGPARMGPYAYLCEEHRTEMRARVYGSRRLKTGPAEERQATLRSAGAPRDGGGGRRVSETPAHVGGARPAAEPVVAGAADGGEATPDLELLPGSDRAPESAAGSTRGLSDIELELQEHHRQIAEKRQEIAGLNADIHLLQEKAERLVQEARERIDRMAAPFAGSTTP